MTSYGAEVEDSRECEAMRKMFVGGLNRDTTEEVFFDYFGQFGNMVDKVIIRDNMTKQSRGFGFITYDRSDCVEAVFQGRPHNIDGKTLDVKRAMPREYNTTTAHSKVTKLFVGGVSPDLTPEELQEYIESRHPTTVGTVDKIDFLKDRETNKNKGFGFLECSDTDFADRLTISENSFVLKGKNMSLKKAEPKPSEGGGSGGRGGGGGMSARGRGGGRGGSRGRGRGRGGGFNNYNSYNNQNNGGYPQSNSYGNYGSTNYHPQYNSNSGYDNYNQSVGYGQQQGSYSQPSYSQPDNGYGGNQGAYGGGHNQHQGGGGRGGWNNNSRYNPY